MNFKDYQQESRRTAEYPNLGNNPFYPVLGLAGESGEVCEKFKKVIRDDGGVLNPEKIEEIKYELGDVLWYITQIATELGLDLEDVAQGNLIKLKSRLERNKIHGQGDNR